MHGEINARIKSFLKPAVFVLHSRYYEYRKRVTFPERIWCKYYKLPLETNTSLKRDWDKQIFPHGIQSQKVKQQKIHSCSEVDTYGSQLTL